MAKIQLYCSNLGMMDGQQFDERVDAVVGRKCYYSSFELVITKVLAGEVDCFRLRKRKETFEYVSAL